MGGAEENTSQDISGMESLRTIIAGSRDLGWQDLESALRTYKAPITEVVCGCAEGIDKCGYRWAREQGIPVTFFPAWANQYSWAYYQNRPGEVIQYPHGGYSGYSRSYGIQRNKRMAEYAEAVLAVWDGDSRGTKSLIELAEYKGLSVVVYTPEKVQQRIFRR